MIFGKTFEQRNAKEYEKKERKQLKNIDYQIALKHEYGRWRAHFPIIPVMIKDGRNVWLRVVFYKKNIELRDGRYTLSPGTMDGYHLMSKGDE